MKTKLALIAVCHLLSAVCFSAFAQGTAFTYQGRLNDGAAPAHGSYDLLFAIYDAASGGSKQAPFVTNSAAAVSNGLFTVTLDFGTGVFPGAARWLDIGVRTNGGGGFTPLEPRQTLTPTPYAVFAGGASNLVGAVSSANLAGTYSQAVTLNNPGNVFEGNGAGVTNVNAATLGGLASSNLWNLGGNAGANPTNGNFIGTSDNLPLEFKVNGVRALRIEPNANGAPNVIAGSANNFVRAGVVGATISGGGATNYFSFSATNKVTADFGTVVGGLQNTASGYTSTAMGVGTTASGDASTAMGQLTTASGSRSTAMGDSTTASGDFSTAMGRNAKANHEGSFVWGDNTGLDIASTAANSVTMRARGGYRLFSDFFANAGVSLAAGGTAWAVLSDRNVKKDFAPLDSRAILEKLAAIPITQWHYQWEDATATPHLGPMAQDFKAAFYPGRDDKSITTQEADGVALAAIQGLNEKLEQTLQKKGAEIEQLKKRLDALEKMMRRTTTQGDR